MTAFIAIVSMVLIGAALLIVLSVIALYTRLARLRDEVRSSRLVIDEKLKERTNEETEDYIRHAVSSYNTAVSNYNGEIRRFPSNIIAGVFEFKEEKFFDSGHE